MHIMDRTAAHVLLLTTLLVATIGSSPVMGAQSDTAADGVCSSSDAGSEGFLHPGSCGSASTQSPQQAATAFIVDISSHELVVCAVNNGTFTVCQPSKADEGKTPPLHSPAGVAVAGSKVIISESTSPGRVRVCDWSGLQVTHCLLSDFEGKWNRGGGVAVDEVHKRVYVAMTLSSVVLSCRLDEDHLSDCDMVDFGLRRGVLMEMPVGVAVANGQLWVTGEAELRRCTLTATGVDGCVVQSLKFVPSGIAVHPSGSPVLMAETEEGRLWVCDADSGSAGKLVKDCRSVYGDNTFLNSSAPQGQESNHPAAVSMAISDDLLYVPTFFGEAVSVCRDAAAAADCTWQAAKDHKFQGLTSIAVVPMVDGHSHPTEPSGDNKSDPTKSDPLV